MTRLAELHRVAFAPWKDKPVVPDADSCDRCHVQDGQQIFVGYGERYNYEGLCDACLGVLFLAANPPQPVERPLVESRP